MVRKKTDATKPNIKEAVLPSGVGTDAEIAESCAALVPGWDDLSDKAKADMVRLSRWVHEQDVAPTMALVVDGPDKGLLQPKANGTLYYLRMAELLGSVSPAHINQRVSEIANYANKSGADDVGKAVSAMLAFVKGVDPKDTAQSTLAVQMAATHDAAMYALGQMRGSQYVEQAKVFGTLGAKLLNAYTRQAEVLTKMQRRGEQVVRHIHVDNRGGQAVIAENVHTGGQGVNAKSGERPDETTTTEILGICAALPCAQPFGQSVPIPGCEGEETMQTARRSSGIGRA